MRDSKLGLRAPFHLSPAIVLLCSLVPRGAAADSCAPTLSGVTSASTASTISLNGVNEGRSVDSTALSTASNAWNSSCSGHDNPGFQTSGSGDMTVNVNFHSGDGPSNGFSQCDSCACTQTQVTNGAVSGATVQMFGQQANGSSCLGAQNEVLTHELGHVLGLGDSSCSGRIMGDVFGSIASGDCDAVDGNFFTDAEHNTDPDGPGDDGPCAV